MYNLKKYSLYILPIIIASIILTVFHTPERDILNSNNIQFQPYNDHISKGKSTVSFKPLENGEISYTFKLNDTIRIPYAGLMILRKDSSFFDLSDYNQINIKIKAESGKNIPFYLFTNIDGFSSWQNTYTFHNIQTDIIADDSFKDISIDFDDFYTPNWWLDLQSTKFDKIPVPDFRKVAVFNFGSFGSADDNKERTVNIEKIVVKKNMTRYYIITSLILVSFYISVFFLRFFRSKDKSNSIINKYVTFPYKKIELAEETDHSSVIFEYINNNYFNSELAISDLKNTTGLNERRISEIIKEKTNLTFKQYINNLRLSEAKRLLIESDLHISEIAYKIGYGNISHFNRVFKSVENISPGEYRLNNSDKFNPES